jgi:hypothetical protein
MGDVGKEDGLDDRLVELLLVSNSGPVVLDSFVGVPSSVLQERSVSRSTREARRAGEIRMDVRLAKRA